MKNYNKEFKKRIEKAKNILLITHNGPDMDAFCSMLITYITLKEKYPKKEVRMESKQHPTTRLPNMQEIHIVKKIDTKGYDLVIVTDAGDISICLEEGEKNENENLLFIDHHITETSDSKKYLTINEGRSSATEQVFAMFRDIYRKSFKVSKEIAELTQYGIVSDTGRFLYEITTPDTLRIFADAKEISSLDLETFSYKFAKFPAEATPAIIEYLHSLTIEGDMAYMYLDLDTIEKKNLEKNGVNEAQSFLRDKYLRYIQGIHWGFIIKPDFDTSNRWFVSFRSGKGYKDVSVIAEKLGGGGHKYAAGVPMMATTGKEVLDRVLEAIHQS